MNYSQFKEVSEQVKLKRPILFELEHDKALTLEQIEKVEREYNIILPQKYRMFLSDFGGGYFGFANIYSLDSDSTFYIFTNNDGIPSGYLPISDNGCGDVYMLKISGNQCSDEIYLWEHDENKITKTKFADVLEYLMEIGLNVNNN